MQIFDKDFKQLFQVSAAIDQIFIEQEPFKKVYFFMLFDAQTIKKILNDI